jgi:multiple sugar transport system substrate-binding protein
MITTDSTDLFTRPVQNQLDRRVHLKIFGLSAIAGVVSLGLLAACTTGAPSVDASKASTGPLTGTLTYASWEWVIPTRGAQIWDALSAFTKENPGVTLKQESIARADYDKTISTQIGAGAGPDLLNIADPLFPTLAAAGVLEPLDGVLSADDTKTLRSINDNYKFKGKQLALVTEISPYALFWNKKIIAQAGVTPPSTFDELLQAAKTVKEKTGKTGFVVRHLMNEASAWWTDFANWPVAFGGGFSENGKLTINSPENIQAVSAFKEIYSSGAFGVGDDASTFRAKFAAGEVGFMIDNSTIIYSIVANNNVVPSSDVGASVLPFPGGSSVYVGNSIAINAHSKNKALAKEFIRWMYAKKAQLSLADAYFPPAVGTNVSASQSKIDANPWITAFDKQGENAQGAIIKGFETQTQQISFIILTQVSRVLSSGVSAKDAMDEAQKEALALG